LDVARRPIAILGLTGQKVATGFLGGILQSHLREHKKGRLKNRYQQREKSRGDQRKFDGGGALPRSAEAGNIPRAAAGIFR
jgi:hypothetical protein